MSMESIARARKTSLQSVRSCSEGVARATTSHEGIPADTKAGVVIESINEVPIADRRGRGEIGIAFGNKIRSLAVPKSPDADQDSREALLRSSLPSKSSISVSFAERLGRGDPAGNGLPGSSSSETHAPVERFSRGGNPSGNGLLGSMTLAKSPNLASFAERLGRGDPSGKGPSSSASSEPLAPVERLGRSGNPAGNGMPGLMTFDNTQSNPSGRGKDFDAEKCLSAGEERVALSEQSRSVVMARTKALASVRSGDAKDKRSVASVDVSQAAQDLGRMVTFQHDHTTPSSSIRQGHEKALSEARKAIEYLERQHPEWLPPSALADPEATRNLRIAALVTRGPDSIARARCVLQRLDAFWLSHRCHFKEDATMFSREALQWFVGSAAVHSADVRGSDSKGTAGNNALKALKLASSIMHFPVSESVLNSEALSSAASPHSVSCSKTSNDGSDKAHMSVDAVLVLHDVADDRFPGSELPLAAPSIFLKAARALYLGALLSLRTKELLRCSVGELGMDHMSVDCSGAKGKSFTTIKPFSTRCPLEGFTGEPISWLSSFHAEVKGLPYVVEGFTFKGKPRVVDDGLGKYLRATSTGEAATQANLDEVWDSILGLAEVDIKEARNAGLTPYALRHLLPDVTMAAGWPQEQRNILGRWAPIAEAKGAPKRSQAKAKRAMPNSYAAGPASLEYELRLRQKAIGIISRAINGAPWWMVVPKQRGALPSFEFLIPDIERESFRRDSDSDFDWLADADEIVSAGKPKAKKAPKRKAPLVVQRRTSQKRPKLSKKGV